MVANGAGARRAAQAIDTAASARAAGAIVHTGFCGGLDPALRIGDIFVADSVQADAAAFPLVRPRCSRPHVCGILASVHRVARTTAEKQALRSRGAAAVEMEAAGVAERARAHGLPLYCVRAVTDLWNESLQNDFQAALRPDGHFATMQILGSAMRRPAARLPELVRLYLRCGIAAQSLGEFLADCQF